MDTTLVPNLKNALVSEDVSAAQADRVAMRIDEARQTIARARAERKKMADEAAEAALKGEIAGADFSILDRAIAEAEAQVEVYSRALEIAQEQLSECRKATTAVLNALRDEQEAQSAAAYNEACARFDAAIAARESTWRTLQAVQRLRGASADVLKTAYAEALASARAE